VNLFNSVTWSFSNQQYMLEVIKKIVVNFLLLKNFSVLYLKNKRSGLLVSIVNVLEVN
jgi:hypothetical protein